MAQAVELPGTLEGAHTLIASLHAYNEKLADQVEQLQHKIDLFLRHRFGQRSERIDPDQYKLAFQELEAEMPSGENDAGDEPEVEIKGYKRRKKGHGRTKFSDDLPRERREVEPLSTDCPCCNEPMKRIGEETSEQIDYQPATLKVIETVRPKYACPTCKEGVTCAPPPKSAIPKSKATAATLAHVAVSKYVDHLPLVRQVSMLARQGVDLSKQTLCGWIRQISDLLEPIERAVWASVLSSDVLMADETTVKLQQPVQCKTAYLWGYLGDRGELVFNFSTTRAAEAPLAALEDFTSGTLVCDGYAGYNEFLRSQKAVERGGCWAHARRKFFEAKSNDKPRSLRVLALIKKLYAVEAEAAGLATWCHSKHERERVVLAVRRMNSVPLLEIIKAALDTLGGQVLPKSPIGTAISYATRQWDDLCRYASDGAIPIDNNAIEREMRPVAVGRRNRHYSAPMLTKRGVARLTEASPELAEELASPHVRVWLTCRSEDVLRGQHWAVIRGPFKSLPDSLVLEPASLVKLVFRGACRRAETAQTEALPEALPDAGQGNIRLSTWGTGARSPGEFSLHLLPHVTYIVTPTGLRADGERISVVLTPPFSDPVALDTSDRSEAWVRVVDRAGNPVVGSRVRLLAPRELHHLPVVVAEARTGSEGEASFAASLIARASLVRVVPPQKRPALGALEIPRRGQSRKVVMVLPAAHSLTGRVVDASGRPISGASVLLRPGPRSASWRRVEVGRGGRYAIPHIVGASTQLLPDAPGVLRPPDWPRQTDWIAGTIHLPADGEQVHVIGPSVIVRVAGAQSNDGRPGELLTLLTDGGVQLRASSQISGNGTATFRGVDLSRAYTVWMPMADPAACVLERGVRFGREAIEVRSRPGHDHTVHVVRRKQKDSLTITVRAVLAPGVSVGGEAIRGVPGAYKLPCLPDVPFTIVATGSRAANGSHTSSEWSGRKIVSPGLSEQVHEIVLTFPEPASTAERQDK